MIKHYLTGAIRAPSFFELNNIFRAFLTIALPIFNVTVGLIIIEKYLENAFNYIGIVNNPCRSAMTIII